MVSALHARFFQRLGFSALLILLIGFDAGPAYACTPAPPTPRFSTTIQVISTDVPKGIAFVESDRYWLTLQNNTSVLVRIPIQDGYVGKDGYQEIAPGDSAGFSDRQIDMLGSESEALFVDGYVGTPLQPRNVIADNRPADARVPEPQIVQVRLLVNQQQFDLQLRVSYRMNEFYAADSVYGYSHACADWANRMLFDELAPVGGLLLGVLLVLAPAIYILWPARDHKAPIDKSQGDH